MAHHSEHPRTPPDDASALHRRTLLAFLSTTALAGCGGGGSSSVANAVSAALGVGTVSTTSLKAKGTGDVYNCSVYTPANYRSGGRSYPIIYALDGDPWMSTMVLVMDLLQIPAILIGIGRYDLRNRDYLLPGCSSFFQFLTQELIPFIELGLRVQTNQRTLVGHSYGGVFCAWAFFVDRLAGRLFSNFLSQDGDFRPASPTDLSVLAIATLMDQLLVGGGPGASTLLLCGSTDANSGNAAFVTSLYAAIARLSFLGLTLILQDYSADHNAMLSPSFGDAMRRLIPGS